MGPPRLSRPPDTKATFSFRMGRTSEAFKPSFRKEPVRKKASTSESAAPPSSAAPSGGFMTEGGRPQAAGGRRSLGPCGLFGAGWAEGAGRSGRGRRAGGLRASRAGGWGGQAGAESVKPPSGGGARLAGGACRRLPHGPPSLGALAACCRAGARVPGPGCLGARSPSPAAAAGSPPRPPACLYCSALLGAPLYFSSSLPPSLSLYLLPSLARSLARPLARGLPPSLSGSPSGSSRRRHPGSSPRLPRLGPRQQ